MTITSTTLITPQIISFPDPITLQNGSTLPSYQLIIETYGELNASKSNATTTDPSDHFPRRQSSLNCCTVHITNITNSPAAKSK